MIFVKKDAPLLSLGLVVFIFASVVKKTVFSLSLGCPNKAFSFS